MRGARRRSPNVHTIELDGEAVLLDEAADRLHRLNATGTSVWLALDGSATAEAIAMALGDSDRETVAAVEALLEHLAAEGLVE